RRGYHGDCAPCRRRAGEGTKFRSVNKMTAAQQQQLAQRIFWISESSTMKMAAETNRLRREGGDVVDFSAGEPDFPTPDNIKNAAIDALHKNFTKYTPVSGTVELKQAICDHHKRTYGTGYSPKECIATVGGKHAIFNLVQALIDPGDE